MNRLALIILISSFTAPALSQNWSGNDNDSILHNFHSSFDSFRQGVLQDYNTYRNSVLTDYSKFLVEVWKEYEAFNGLSKYKLPKPKQPPKENTSNQAVPKKIEPIVPDLTSMPNRPQPNIVSTPPLAPNPIIPTLGDVAINYYGMTLKLPQLHLKPLNNIGPKSVASAWKELQQMYIDKEVCPRLQQLSISLGLNDWFMFELVRQYSNQVAPDRNMRILLAQFLMANLNYNVRIAKTDRQLLLLVSIKQMIYYNMYTDIYGSKYYTFADDLEPIDETGDMRIYTCDLPQSSNLGNSIDMVINRKMNIDEGQYHQYNISSDGISISGKVNTTVLKMLDAYPCVDIPFIASSNVLPSTRMEVIDQIRSTIQNLNEIQAVRTILHFVQHGFKYATDEDQHGREKYYFFEENLYYPKNDCEDRAIFFAYIVHNLLGLDVHLLYYPGHECTAVKFNERVDGDGYTYKGGTYLICDPTYIGADIGRCMPQYRDTQPKIELWY